MIITTIMLIASVGVASPSERSGTASTEHAVVRVSPDAVSAIRLPHGEKVVEMVVQDPVGVDAAVVTEGMIAVKGSVDPRGTHLLVRRAEGRPLDLLLLPASAGARSQVVRIGARDADPVPEWHLAARDVSVLKPGFRVMQAYASNGVRVEAMPSDGVFVATGGSSGHGDVLVVGEGGETGIYRLD